jgi:hypothetical protein
MSDFKTDPSGGSAILFKPGETLEITLADGDGTIEFQATVVSHASPLVEVEHAGKSIVYNTGSAHFISATRKP